VKTTHRHIVDNALFLQKKDNRKSLLTLGAAITVETWMAAYGKLSGKDRPPSVRLSVMGSYMVQVNTPPLFRPLAGNDAHNLRKLPEHKNSFHPMGCVTPLLSGIPERVKPV
jgi:hypothetical protein